MTCFVECDWLVSMLIFIDHVLGARTKLNMFCLESYLFTFELKYLKRKINQQINKLSAACSFTLSLAVL